MQEDEITKINSAFVTECQNVINSIEIQLEVAKEEQKNLKDEFYELVSENQKLSDALDSEFQEKIKGSEGEPHFEVFQSEIFLNLQKQLDLCKKEKEKTIELYKTSLNLIEKLEVELSSQRETSQDVGQAKTSISTPVIAVLEAKLKNTKEHLEMVMIGREQLESENVKHQTEIAKLKLNIESNNKIIDQLKSREEEWKNNYRKVEQDNTLLNATYECVLQSRNDLEKKLEIYALRVQDLVQKNSESRNKVEEALDVVEKALMEKDAAINREVQLQEEINKLHLCLDHVIEEAGKKIGTEVNEAKNKYESNTKNLLTELSNVKKELEKKKTEYKRMSFKYKKLEKIASAKLDKEKISLIKGSETEITILENHLDSVYQELERLKVKYEDLEKDKKKLEKDFSELIEKHRNLMSDTEAKETSFEEIIRELESQIERKIEDLNESSRRAEFFLNQVRDLQEENKNLAAAVGNCHCSRLKAKIKKLSETCGSQKMELQSHIESQMKLNEIWKSEIKEITGKFEEKIRELKKECSQLKAKNKKLTSELNTAKKKIFSLENV